MSIIGIDIGGTQIKAALLTPGGQIISRTTVPTPADSRPPAVVAAVTTIVQSLSDLTTDPVTAVGIGVPGPVDSHAGQVITCVNLRDWRDVPLAKLVREATGLHTAIENDANAAAFGEFKAANREHTDWQCVVFMTLGTGIGGGIIVEGQPLRGQGLAAELGHIVVRPKGRMCTCGQRGCLERYASATALIRDTQKRLNGDSLAGKNADQFDARDVAIAAAEGNSHAVAAFDELANYLARGCLTIIRVLDPDAIILGGGLAAAGDVLRKPLLAHLEQQNWHVAPVRVAIDFARLGNDAGLIGAGSLANQEWSGDETADSGK